VRFQAQTFWLAKDVEDPDQYQDAFELDAERGIAAVADGVSSAIFSGPWARVLTQAVVAEPPPLEDPEAFQAWLARQRECWSSQIDTSRLTWYQRPKMVDGAMTTLLWIELTPLELGENGLATSYQLRAYAIGDTCLFHLRDGQTLTMFPLARSEEFGLNPAVVGSIDRKRDHLLEFKAWEATCLPNDLLVLCTDAIALWAYHLAEAGEPVNWENYTTLSDEQWREEIALHRQQSEMRFDDCTLVLLRVIEELPSPSVMPEVEIAPGDGLELPCDEIPAVALQLTCEDVVGATELAESVEAPLDLVEESAPPEPSVEPLDTPESNHEG
jgi:hypothetical protein